MLAPGAKKASFGPACIHLWLLSFEIFKRFEFLQMIFCSNGEMLDIIAMPQT